MQTKRCMLLSGLGKTNIAVCKTNSPFKLTIYVDLDKSTLSIPYVKFDPVGRVYTIL